MGFQLTAVHFFRAVYPLCRLWQTKFSAEVWAEIDSDEKYGAQNGGKGIKAGKNILLDGVQKDLF